MASSFRVPAFIASFLVAASLLSPAEDRVVASAPVLQPASAVHIRGWLDGQGSPGFLEGDPRGPEVWAALRAFYETRHFEPAWTGSGEPTPGARAFVLREDDWLRDGLSPQRYDPGAYLGEQPEVLRASSGEPALLARLDVAITFSFLRAASDLARGQAAPGRMPFWRSETKHLDLAVLAAEAVAGDRPLQILDRLRPAHPQYAALREALGRYRRLAEDGGWAVLEIRTPLRPGRRAPGVVALRRRLAASGDLDPRASLDLAVYDAHLREAVAAFQGRHGLAADGIVDGATLEALNVPVQERIRQIELNLERWRWRSWSPEGRSILVNIPTFELHAYDGHREALRMRVVTGKGQSPTSVFDEMMDTIVFRPHWNVPPNILETEILPAVRRDPGYLARRRMEMVGTGYGVQVRQLPGPGNSLGLVKFLFPNPYHIYLHDTPERHLFARSRRAFSHGCVRVERPEDLARFVLQGAPQWTAQRIAAAMRSGGERYVKLSQPLPVAIAYFTTWVDADGTVRFAPDVYRHDRAQHPLLLPRPAARPAIAASVS